MAKMRVVLGAAAAMFAAALFMSQPAQAFCVNNASEDALDVFAGECEDCMRTSIKPSETLCCPADKPECQGTTLTFKRETEHDALAWRDCSSKTPDDGWVVLFTDPMTADEEGNRSGSVGGIGCRVMEVMGTPVGEGVISPSRTCPQVERNAPAAC